MCGGCGLLVTAETLLTNMIGSVISQNFIGKMAFMTEHKLKSEEVGRGPRAHT